MRIIPTLFSRYLSKNFFLAFIATLIVLMGFILLFDVIELLRRSASRDHVTFGEVFGLGLLKLPQMIPLILPFAILIAALITFYRFSKSNELVIAKSVGLSSWNFLMPVLGVVFLIGVANVTLFNPISAVMYKRYQTVEDAVFRRSTSLSWSSKGLWLREKRDGHSYVFYAQKVKQLERSLILQDTFLLELDENETLLRQIEAKKSSLRSNLLVMVDAVAYDGEDKKEAIPLFTLPTEFSVDKILRTFDQPEEISFWQLPSFIQTLENASFSTTRYKMHFYALLASIVHLLAMVFIAAVFGLIPNQRQGGALIKTTGAFACAFVLFFLSKLTTALGTSGSLPYFLAGFGPYIVTILLAATALIHQEDG